VAAELEAMQQGRMVPPPPTPPPSDAEDKNRIDKLCHFVAKNGAGFEEMMKGKEQNNPRFAFIFPGMRH
jgi:hypothetical protein